MTRVEVVWGDAHAKLEDISLEEARRVTHQVTHSVGWLVARNDDGLVLAVDRWPGHDSAGSWHFIPQGMILEVIELQPVDTSDYAETILGV